MKIYTYEFDGRKFVFEPVLDKRRNPIVTPAGFMKAKDGCNSTYLKTSTFDQRSFRSECCRRATPDEVEEYNKLKAIHPDFQEGAKYYEPQVMDLQDEAQADEDESFGLPDLDNKEPSPTLDISELISKTQDLLNDGYLDMAAAGSVKIQDFVDAEGKVYELRVNATLKSDKKEQLNEIMNLASSLVEECVEQHGVTIRRPEEGEVKRIAAGIDFPKILTKENFWNDLRGSREFEIFQDWVDKYKVRNNWKELLGSYIKFHDLPTAMQLGIFLQYITERKGDADIAHNFTEDADDLSVPKMIEIMKIWFIE